MSGHSHWAGIKHKKAIVDAKKGKIFTKYARLITVAAREGGGNPDMNAKLRLALDKARLSGMPKDNMERAIKKGTGGGDGGVQMEEVTYEGFGPGGAAILVEALTDNRNRTVSEVRRIFETKGGNMGGPGSVAWMFERKGVITVESSVGNEDRVMELVLESGADDFRSGDGSYQILTAPQSLQKTADFLKSKNIQPRSAELSNLPKNMTSVSSQDALKVAALLEALEDNDDVQDVYTNCEFTDDVIAQIEKS